MEEIIPLNIQEFKILIQYKNFIRKLGRDTVSKTLLAKNLSAITELAKIVLKDYEECKKTSISTYIVVGKSEKRHPKNRTLFKYGSGSRTSSSDESHESNEILKKCYNETNSENEEEEEGKQKSNYLDY